MKKLYEWEDEQFNILGTTFDVWKAQKMIQKNPEKYMDDGKPYKLDIESMGEMISPSLTKQQEEDLKNGKTVSIKMGVHVDSNHALEMTEERLNEPGILINWKGDPFLIDGWHRVYARLQKGLKDMDVYYISSTKEVNSLLT